MASRLLRAENDGGFAQLRTRWVTTGSIGYVTKPPMRSHLAGGAYVRLIISPSTYTAMKATIFSALFPSMRIGPVLRDWGAYLASPVTTKSSRPITHRPQP